MRKEEREGSGKTKERKWFKFSCKPKAKLNELRKFR